MAQVIYSTKFVTDQFEKKLPKTWSLFHYVSKPNLWSFSRKMKQVAVMYKKASGRELVFRLTDRNTLKRFQDLAKVAEKYGYKVTIEVL